MKKGSRHTIEARKKISLNGFHYGMLGKKLSLKTKKIMSENHKGIKNYWYGKKLSDEHRKKLKNVRIKFYKNGGVHPKGMLNKKSSEETKRKLSESHKGNKSCLWKGGISYEPYSVDWTRTLKRSVRERDHYTCQVCGALQSDRAFDCHHIDYNKKNCNPDNLILLCNSCHSKTSHNRDYWIKYFNN